MLRQLDSGREVFCLPIHAQPQGQHLGAAREARALSNNSQSEPQWVTVTSSRLDAVMYEPNRRVLSVRFKNGAESSYQGVEPEIARGLIKAPSPGRFFADNIKGRYDCS